MKLPKRFLEVQMDTTGMCNLRCRMCYLSYSKRPSIFMEPDVFRHIAREVFPHARRLVLSWATEPLLHPKLPELLAITREYDIPEVLLVTNATRLTRELSETLIREKVDRINVSMEGATPETYEAVRLGASFEKTLENLEQFEAVRKAARSRKPRLMFNYLLMRSTASELPDFIRLVKRFRPTEINTWFPNVHEGAPKEDFIDIGNETFREMLPEARRAAKEAGITLYLPYVSPEYPGIRARLHRAGWSLRKVSGFLRHKSVRASWLWIRTMLALRRQVPTSFCWDPSFRLVIWPDGSVQPCCRWEPDPLGTIAGVSFEEVWNSEAWQKLREALRAGKEVPEICRGCTIASSRKVF